ncbi:DUF2264 domain-containing protein [Microlunatus soli]|uniref:DUF2264 domain-containing protein n=1 Tax=Microlunatus soli TaxID=630515 RepID=A0A1H1Y6M7_9ACTN|nr:DUF2264 domain-containing protein [Microlunatus soli]SDT17120.1 hypothetical protein SAMN04489812_4424 [Microlunatus soli]
MDDRQQLESFADKAFLALRPFATAGHARFELPGPSSHAGPISDGLEAFARSFLGVGYRLAGVDPDQPGGDDHDHAGWYAAGLIAGTDPDSAERWPALTEIAQSRVEAAAIAIALHESRSWIWDRLDDGARQRIVDWLAPSATVRYGDNNWLWFCNVTQAFLRSVGGPYDQQLIDDNIARLDSWYLGDVDGRGGWYRDGPQGTVDWYNGWVMQLFSLWYCRMSAGEPGVEALLERYRPRLSDYVDRLPGLWGGDGAPLFQGRSLIYRYATAGAAWAGAIFDAATVGAGRLRRLGLQTVRYFADRGAFDDSGLLSMGWLGRHESMRQPYSGPGSPYWASHGLAGLVLPADDSFWSAPDEPLPVDQGDTTDVIAQPGWLVSGTRADGIVRIANHGVDHGGDREDPLYNRLAYSTATAPVESAADVADNQVMLTGPAGATTRVGFERLDFDAEQGIAGSSWGPISCWSVIDSGVEVRAVRLAATADLTGQRLVISGYAIPQYPQPGARQQLRSEVRSLLGDVSARTVIHSGANAFGSGLMINYLAIEDPEPDRWYVVAVSLTESTEEPAWPTAAISDDQRLHLTWQDRVTVVG